MIQPTRYIVDRKIIEKVSNFESTGKLSINEPTGDFFYDPWKIKSEFVGTEFETALKYLPGPIGEARLITLEPGRCYFSHSDIDDRYHLNITGDCSAIINLETGQSYFLKPDCIWYDMNAGPLHSAVNYGQFNRKQIVVRKLLQKNKLKSPIKIFIRVKGSNSRFVFDNTISPWLNYANKAGIISNFEHNMASLYFDVEEQYKKELEIIIPEQFDYAYD